MCTHAPMAPWVDTFLLFRTQHFGQYLGVPAHLAGYGRLHRTENFVFLHTSARSCGNLGSVSGKRLGDSAP